LSLPEVNCLILTAHDDDEDLFNSIIAGAAGFLARPVGGDTLLDAIRTVASGRSLLDPSVTSRVLMRLRQGNEREVRVGKLTDQERRILMLISEGLTNQEISEELGIPAAAVRRYVSTMLKTLGVERRAKAAAYAARIMGQR
jgi:DNA-binding NarL/FixJ family response regulator